MKLQDGIDFTTLNWVKQELDETLKQARQALEAYVEDPADSSLMRFCATYLHQVQGTLRMVELYGAAMVVEEMERVALALLDGNVKPQDETYAVLMRGIVQLPDYLERLQSGHKDIPIVLLPLLNDLRATRGEKLLTESVLFSPDLSAPLPTAADAPVTLPEMELKSEAARLRTAFQLSLLRWIRDDQPQVQLQRLITVLDRLRAVCREENCQRLWWVSTGVLESVASGAQETNVALKLLFGKVDREIKRLLDGGEGSFRTSPPVDLTKNLLYYIAHAAASGPRATEIRQVYKLDTLLPSEKELEHAKGSISGHNRTLLDTVSAAIKDDLMRVKEALDIFLRAQNGDQAELMAQVDVLDRVGDTLGMLGLGMPRRVVLDQRKIMEEIGNNTRAADESALLDVAGALLYVEASLDDHIERLGADTTSDAISVNPHDLELPKAEVRKILDALMKEASVNITQAKQDIVAFIESPWDHARVEPIPRLLEEIAGALRMLNLSESAQLMNGIVRFVEVELLRHRRVPTVEQMDKLADALASIEYYMEATREQRGGRDKILDVTRQSLTALGYWPVPQDDGGGPPPTPSSPSDVPPGNKRETSRTQNDSVSAFGSPFSTPAFAAPTVATADAQDGEFPRWGSENMPASGEEGLKLGDELRAELSSIEPMEQMPSVELTNESIDAYIARIGATNETPDDIQPHAIEMDSASDQIADVNPPHVEIAPGHGLEDLIVGEAKTHYPVEHDLSGLRLVETESAATPAPSVRYVEVEEEIEEEVPDVDASSPMADASFSATPSDDIDEEIREVFVEEVQDEIDNLNRALPAWKSDANDFEKLKPIRRSFHTLKGSGRLVGALALGEFSWKVENMLNRVLDKTIPPSAHVQALVDSAVGVLPELLGALRGEGMPKSDIGQIMDVADKIATGEEAWVRAGAAQRMKKVKRVVRKLVAVVDDTPAESSTASFGEPQSSSRADIADDFDVERAFGTSADYVQSTHGDINPFAEDEIIAGPLPNIDPVLFDILKSEVASHLDTIDGYLDALKATPGTPATEPLLRAVHTLNGAIAMVDIPVISAVLAPLEGYVKRLRARQQAPDAAGAAAMAETSQLVAGVIAELQNDNPQMPNSDELAARVAQLRDTLPEPEMMHTLFSLAEDEAREPVAAAEDSTGADTLIDFDTTSIEALPTHETDARSFADESVTEHPQLAENSTHEDDLTASFIRELEAKEAGERAAAEAAAVAQVHAIEERMAREAAEQAAAETARREAEANQPMPEETELLSFDDLARNEEPAETVELSSERVEEREAAQPTAEVPSDEQIEETVMAFESLPEVAEIAPEPKAVEAAQPETAFMRSVAHFPPLADDPQPDGKLELPDMDEDLLEIFVQEGDDILDHSDSLMAKLRESPQDRDLVTGLQRDLHTLKGGARMAGLAPIGDLSHAMESLLESISENRRMMDRVTVDSLERGFDRLHGLVQRVSRRQALSMPEHAIARFEGLVSGELPSMPASSVAPAETIVETTPGAEKAPLEAPKAEASAPGAAKAPPPPRPIRQQLVEEEDPAARAPQEMIRVRSDLLDSLVNYAGEVSIYRSRLEQQISTFRFNLIEFEQTVSRLREQLRKLELETEAQILSRYQREQHESDAAFDPLELDRFSQLQQLSRALAESVSDLVSIQGLLDDLTRQSETLLLQQSRVSSDLQEGLMRTRMVPFDSLVPSLRRTLRQAAQEVGKRAQLKVEGAQGEMDRNLLERMKAPFEHMLRNALAHGIESPDDRTAVDKPAEGSVTIQVSREATEVVLRVSDDGKGMDRDAIRKKAIERGLLKPDAQLSDRDLYGFILETGFSTAEHVTQLAGRGVGMDVVHNEIKQLGGSLAIDSHLGKGSIFTIRLPFTLAVTQAILVRLGDSTYAVPMSSVQGVVRIAREDLARRMNLPNPAYTYAGDEYLIYELSQLLNLPPARMSDETQLPLLMTRTGDQRAAVRIDGVIGSREIVVKSVGPQISSVPGIFGATIMGDGSVVMILDLAPLVRRSAALRDRVEAGEMPAPVAPPPMPVVETRAQPLIMVVDDSITMRKVTTRVLERNDMEVITAKDGLDAVEKLQDKVPDIVLLDVEMPRMDGYELATYMKNDARLKLVPIIMITSRTGEKHRQRALEIGVERYLGKPYQEADLLRNVQETLRLSRA
ncbi:MAG TPA: Hpt domain-containing protein [Rudaea sp.]|jgi:chemosensory pili system protein ChpA (sensor histidine kinase/response regulator)|nr:Hpt domain-containing protein [Rudaea sp.]